MALGDFADACSSNPYLSLNVGTVQEFFKAIGIAGIVGLVVILLCGFYAIKALASGSAIKVLIFVLLGLAIFVPIKSAASDAANSLNPCTPTTPTTNPGLSLSANLQVISNTRNLA